MAASNVPHLVKHCTLAIWREGGVSGGKRERFISAWNIARSRLVEYGFLSKGSETGTSEDIKLTSKGTQREAFHQREPGGKTKSMLFDQMFRWIELAEQEQDEKPETVAGAEDRDENADAKQDAAVVKPKLNFAKKAKTKKPEPKSKLGGLFKSVRGKPFDKPKK